MIDTAISVQTQIFIRSFLSSGVLVTANASKLALQHQNIDGSTPKIPEWVFLGPGDIIGKMVGLSEEGRQLGMQNVKNRLLHAPAA